jgi:glycerol-3-phosphate acyltransferase PlsX
VQHAADSIAGDTKPTAALRMRQSSMRLAIDAVANGSASGVVSAGNTGALLTLAKIVLKTLPGIDRPAMAAIGPSARGDVVMLDLGANVLCDTRNLVEFAVMGDVFARTVLGLTAPTIGLLNVGSEEMKGDETLRRAADILRASHIAPQFHGFVEGHDIAAGTTDVIVTDGFTGNIALKTGEGALKLIGQLLRQVFSSGIAARLGYLLARPGLDRLREWLDPRRYNGAVMLGLAGVVVKSHGGTDAQGFAHAVDVAMDMVVHRFNDGMRDGLGKIVGLQQLKPAPEPVTRAAGEQGTGSEDGSGSSGAGPLAAAG